MFRWTSLLATSVAMCGAAISGCDSTAGKATGDAVAGKAIVDKVCAECHPNEDWSDQAAATVEAKIKDIIAGKKKHKLKITLTDEEVANVSAYWTRKDRE